ncbi:MAG: NrdH-redoxin [Candidatus Cloacimonetes bacterium]|nr:NrdH-redoxin [Candidatus Cloacimonadota bacterium]
MKQITIYSTPICPYCEMTKDYFRKKGIEFTEIDVAADAANAQEMIRVSGQMGVPVIKIGNEVIVGFDEVKIDAALKSQASQ